ncbi:MAG TPA: ATP-binding protein [Candidatus Dojkabacteria bacterium]|nr:ATP-binding protein [Candidatus Dojkabacteria bacterium]
MTKLIGRVAATEKIPTTIDEFYFWTDKEKILNPFDVIKAKHIQDSYTFGVVEEISHITDAPSYLASYISSDFGDVSYKANTQRVGLNFVKAKVIGNTKDIYTPVLDCSEVSLGNEKEVQKALGLDEVKNPLACGYIEMYEAKDKIRLPVFLNSDFLLGPEGAHLNISGISGLAAKTSYSMFLIKAVQQRYLQKDIPKNESVAFVLFNIKGRDLLAIDEQNADLSEKDKELYSNLKLNDQPFENVTYFYPYDKNDSINTYAKTKDVETQIDANKAFKYKYLYEQDKDCMELFFSNIDDPQETMSSIINLILNGEANFGDIRSWEDFVEEVKSYTEKNASGKDKSISVLSWRKFLRIIRKSLTNPIFAKRVVPTKNETRLREYITQKIKKNDVYVIDIAKLDEDMQAFVFGDVVNSIYEMKLGQVGDREPDEIPSKIVIFVDELNKYASGDVPKNSPILRKIIEITERGRSLGLILFSAEQFKSAIHDRVKGNCSTHAYGRTNAIEVSKNDYKYLPTVYKGMMTRLPQGEYIIQNPVLRSLLNIKFPNPVYKQFKNG